MILQLMSDLIKSMVAYNVNYSQNSHTFIDQICHNISYNESVVTKKEHLLSWTVYRTLSF